VLFINAVNWTNQRSVLFNNVVNWTDYRSVLFKDRKPNEIIRGKMDAQDMILDNPKTTNLYGHVERMDPTRLPKIMIQWEPEGRKKRGRPQRTWKEGIYIAMKERDLRMGELNRRQWSMAAGRRRQTL
jgi:hypothetical protein